MDPLTLSRIQFGDTAAFHILWPLLSIGLAFFMFIMEVMWLKTKDERYYRQLKFWLKIFLLSFAIGVASGFPLSFQFGTNWAAFSAAAGSFFGNILGFETTIAFTLETASLGILVFGWKRVPKLVHLLANLGVLVGSSLSGFWIVAANSWMQIPHGVIMEGGKIVVVDYMAAIFNPSTVVSFAHMWIACITSTLFFMAGISAIILLSKKADEAKKAFFLFTFKFALGLALILTPLQIGVGDLIGEVIAKHQPAKLAAVELHWNTNLPGEGADWAVLAWPNKDGGKNDFEFALPDALSLIVTKTQTGEVKGLNEFAPEDRPSILNSIMVFYSFRIMVGIGMLMLFLTIWGAWLWKKKKLVLPTITKHRWFLRAFVLSIPIGFIATEAGWMVREIGRQPWVIYGLMRTKDALSSHLETPVIFSVIASISALYLAMFIAFVYFTVRLLQEGPDLTSPVP